MTPKQNKSRRATLSNAHRDHTKGLNAHAFFKLDDHAIGEDLVQDTFLKTWKYLAKGGKIEVMKAFLFHILNNLIIDEYRKRKNRSSSLDVLIENGFEPAAGGQDRLINIMDGKAAQLLIERLPVSFHKVMRMRYVQDLTLAEMSLITGQSKNTLAVHVHRGLAKLKLLYATA